MGNIGERTPARKEEVMKQARLVALLLVVLLGSAGCLPDLVVKELTVNWDLENNTAKAEAEICNVGNRNAGEFMVYFNAEEQPVSPNRRPQVSFWIVGLARGESVILEANFAPLAHPDNNNLGNVYKIRVLADPKHMVKELNEDNNDREQPIVPGALPDLVVTDIFQDGPHYLVAKYKNIGAAGQGDFLIKFSAGALSFPGNSLYRFPVPPPGEEQQTGGLTIGLIGLQQGSVADVTAEIDWEQRVNESNEDNNVLTKHIQIQ